MSEMRQVPEGWEIDNFKSLKIKLIDGDRGENYPKDDDFFEHGYCVFLSAKNVTKNGFKFNELQFINQEKDEKLRKGKLEKEDIVLTTRGTVGNIAYFDNTINYNHIRINSGMILLRNENKSLETNYLHTFLKSNIFDYQIANTVFGSAQPQLTVKEIEKFFICFPKEKKEQEKIAKILSTLDKTIESTNRLIEKEKHIKTALMQELLTNGIDQNGQIRSPQTHTYKPSELGLVPDEWEVVSLDDFFKLKSGDTKPEDTSNNGIYEVYGGNGITGYSNSKNNNEETLIIGRVGEYCGSIYLVNECWITDNALYITKKIKKFDTKYMFYLLYFLNLNQYKAETGQPLLNQTIIGNVQTSYPRNYEEQKQIAKILTTQDKKIETEETNLAKLKELKKG